MSRSELLETEGFNQLAAAKDGYLLYNRNDAFIGRSVQKYGEYNFYGDSENCYPDIGSINMLCVHRDAEVPFEGLEEVDAPSSHPLRR